MKKKLLTLLMFFGFATASFANSKIENNFADKKILIAYYSRSGNTEVVAKEIQKKVGGELFEIETASQYPNNYRKTTEVAKKQIENGEKPALKNKKDISEYDIIFVGTPAWWGKMAPAVTTFLSENNFKGKVVLPFVTHGGGGGYSIDEDMKEITKAETMDSFVTYGRSIDEKELDKWLEEMRF